LRADPAAKKDPDASDVAALWLLPAAGGEARVVAALPGGVTAAEVARDAGGIVVGAPVLPAAGNGDSAAEDARLRQERKDAGITAILHESAPVRFWDHDLGPTSPGCSPSIPTRCRKPRSGGPAGTRSRRWPTTPPPKGPNARRIPPAFATLRPSPGGRWTASRSS
jgi:hypothetical protein